MPIVETRVINFIRPDIGFVNLTDHTPEIKFSHGMISLLDSFLRTSFFGQQQFALSHALLISAKFQAKDKTNKTNKQVNQNQ